MHRYIEHLELSTARQIEDLQHCQIFDELKNIGC